MSIVIATRGPKSGQCNICGDIGPLTEDHTPPKGCVKPTQVEIRHISSHLGSGPPTSRARRSQNGVKYRTLCSRCNNGLLGAKYDPALIEFTTSVSSILKSSIYLPYQLNVEAQPQAVMRSVLGHIAAQGVDRYKKGPLTEAVRDYILDESLPLPQGIHMFYWAYPHTAHVMVRDAALMNLSAGKNAFSLWLLKFYPVAFLIAWDQPHGLEYLPHSFESLRQLPFACRAELPLTLRPTIPAYWPEAPTDNSFIMYGQEAIHAVA